MVESIHLWIEYLIRFSHLVAGIAWIGSSFYFIWLDSAFETPQEPKPHLDGELFMVHGGFYYKVEKKKIFPGELPKTLHWFKWEATLTWITGFLLLIVVYFANGAQLLIDKNVMLLMPWQGIALSLLLATAFWFIYDFIWHRFKNRIISASSSLILLAMMIYINTHTFSGRGAFIQTGFMMGSMMLLNVWVRILPGQRKMVKDAEAGKIPDYSFSAKAKTRSVHNTYFIFPVLFIMLSNHYAPIYNHPKSWVLLILLSVSGAMVRHAMVTKINKERWTLLPAAIGLLSMVVMTADSFKRAADSINVPDNLQWSDVKPIFQKRCNSCHSNNPIDDVIKAAPSGVIFEEEEETKMYLPRIYQQVVVARTMPLGNKTNIDEEERAYLGKWTQEQMKKESK